MIFEKFNVEGISGSVIVVTFTIGFLIIARLVGILLIYNRGYIIILALFPIRIDSCEYKNAHLKSYFSSFKVISFNIAKFSWTKIA